MTEERPLVFLDLETTGTNIAKDRIAEIGMVKVSGQCQIEEFHRYINPTIPMQAEAAAVTQLTDDFLKDKPTFKDVCESIHAFIKGCDIAGHNVVFFDIPLLVEEFLRVNINFPTDDTLFIDTKEIQAHLFPRTLSYIYESLTGNKPMDDQTHTAMYDVTMCAEVLVKQREIFEQKALSQSREDLHRISTRGRKLVDFAGRLAINKDGDIVYTFGKNDGKTVFSDPNYAEWILKGDFTMDTKRWVKHALMNKGKLKGQSIITF